MNTVPSPSTDGWEHFPHEADIGLHGYGATPEAAFEQAALAMTAAVTDPAGVRPEVSVAIRCSAPDRELLLVDWLNALVFEMATRHMLFGRFEVAIEDDVLSGAAWGERVDIARHRPVVEVKGATYTELAVAPREDGRWHARCVIDV